MYENSGFVHQRFRELKKERRFKSARALTAAMALPPYTVNKILSGDVKKTTDQIHFRAILDHIGMTEEEFFKLSLKPKAIASSLPVSAPTHQDKVPLFGEIPAGPTSLVDGLPEADEYINPVPGLRKNGVYALRVHGLSMSPHLLPGDIVFLESLDIHIGPKHQRLLAPRLLFERIHGRMVAALVDNEATLKVLRVTPKPGTEDYDLHLLPVNHADGYRDLYVKPESELRIQGVVVKVLRDATMPILSMVQGGTHAG